MSILSSRLKDLHASPVREMLSVALRPEVISFAGGLPAQDSFADLGLPAPSQDLLQYGPTEGEPALRALIGDELQALGLDAPAERVLVLSGSQQGIDLVAKLCVDEGAGVAVEAPAYLAALQVFSGYEVEFEVVGSDDGGMKVDELEAVLARRKAKLIYIVADFHNPKGTSLASIIGFVELTRAGQMLNNSTFHPFAIFATVAAIYFILCWPLSLAARGLERRMTAAYQR